MEKELLEFIMANLDLEQEEAGELISTLLVLTGAFVLDGSRVKKKAKALNDENKAYIKKPKEYPMVLIAAYNEESGIQGTIQSFLDSGYPKENIFVADDGSKDRTRELCLAILPGKNVITKKNRGKVSATHQALMQIQKNGACSDYIILTDGDLTYKGGNINLEYLRKEKITSGAFYVMPVIKNQAELMTRILSELQDFEYQKSMLVGRQFHSRTGNVLCASGAGGIFEFKRLLRLMKEHSGIFTGDDLERTLIDLKFGGKTIFLKNEKIITEAPSSFLGKEGLLRQRYRKWWPGFWRNIPLLMQISIRNRKQNKELSKATLSEVFFTALDPFKFIFIGGLAAKDQEELIVVLYIFYTFVELLIYRKIYKENNTPVPRFFVVPLSPIYGMLQSLLRTVAIGVVLNEKIFKDEWEEAKGHMLSEEDFLKKHKSE